MEKIQNDFELKKKHGNRFLSEDELKERKNIFDVFKLIKLFLIKGYTKSKTSLKKKIIKTYLKF
mgnify:CR=1 FL=1